MIMVKYLMRLWNCNFCFGILIFTLINCTILYSQTESTFIFSDSPKITGDELIKLTNYYSIDVLDIKNFTVSAIRWMDIDNYGNLYVLAHLEKQILVFDKKGNFLRKMGGPGQSSTELERPHSFYVHNDKLYIFEEYRGIKIWELNGNYIDFILKASSQAGDIMQSPLFRPVSGGYIGVHWEFLGDPRGKFHKLNILARYNDKLNIVNEIATANIDPIKYFNYVLVEIIALDSENNLYFPVLIDPYKYIINKYDLKGNKIISFGRKFKNQRYSSRTIKWYQEKYGKKHLNSSVIRAVPYQLAQYTPIIRHIIVDNNDLIWVIVGEWYPDNQSYFKLTSTIDIFNTNGEFLYSFQSNKFSRSCFIKNDLLYSKPIANRFLTSSEEHTINVYKINIAFPK